LYQRVDLGKHTKSECEMFWIKKKIMWFKWIWKKNCES